MYKTFIFNELQNSKADLIKHVQFNCWTKVSCPHHFLVTVV